MFNVQLALSDDTRASSAESDQQRVRFFSGEFREVAIMCKERRYLYDRILASEVLYNPEAYASIVDALSLVLHACLKSV